MSAKPLTVTAEQGVAIKKLTRLAKTWPKSLWLFSASGSLSVMRKGRDGEHVVTASGGIDPDYILATINIENDGGDW